MFKQNEQVMRSDNVSGDQLSPLKKDVNGQYVFPETPCGILPFYINQENTIVWGCVETNRVGIKSVHPPAGTQDIIIMKGNERFSLEVSKPLREFNKDFLKHFTGKNFSGQNYQEIIACFIDNGYQVFLENMLTTATHESQEEHGIDLRNEHGVNKDLLIDMYDFEPQLVKAKRGTTTQKIYTAYLSHSVGIHLNHTNKIEEKILINKGRSFYEKGVWSTLEELKSSFQADKLSFIAGEKTENTFTVEQKNLINQELIACESRIELIEKIEASMVICLKELNINSVAQSATIPFSLMDKEVNSQLNLK